MAMTCTTSSSSSSSSSLWSEKRSGVHTRHAVTPPATSTALHAHKRQSMRSSEAAGVSSSEAREGEARLLGTVVSAQANYVRVATHTHALHSTRAASGHDATPTPPSAATTTMSLETGEENDKDEKDKEEEEEEEEEDTSLLLCKVRTLLKKLGVKVLVGDTVELRRVSESMQRAVVYDVLPRRSQLSDPAVANVDQVVVVFSMARPAPQPLQVSRFLLTAEASGLPVKLVLNKSDLIASEEKDSNTDEEDRYHHHRGHAHARDENANEHHDGEMCAADWPERLREWGYDPLLVSTVTGDGLESFREMLGSRVSVLAGPSGVGKSSIVNALRHGEDEERVGEVSAKGRGRHTTRHVSLLDCGNGGLLADTPGLSCTSLESVSDAQLPLLFPEVRTLLEESGGCRFSDCVHVHEPGCSVSGANWERYEHYLYFREEVGAMNERRRTGKAKSLLAMSEQHNDVARLYKSVSRRGGETVHVPLLSRKKHRRIGRGAARRRARAEQEENHLEMLDAIDSSDRDADDAADDEANLSHPQLT